MFNNLENLCYSFLHVLIIDIRTSRFDLVNGDVHGHVDDQFGEYLGIDVFSDSTFFLVGFDVSGILIHRNAP